MNVGNPGSRFARRTLGAMLAVLGLCVVATVPARAQEVEWTQRLVSGPSPRYAHAMAYDAARGVTILFGGYVGTFPTRNGETWEWNGTAWTQRAVSGPSARGHHAMAYDAARRVTVLFGGVGAGYVYNGETWEWNGTAWTQRAVSGPSPRVYHAMAYDAARAVTVLFGGYTGSARSAETWEWNGTVWTQRFVSGPSPRDEHAMVYDAARSVTVLFGGYTDSGYNGETWEWNGTIWTQQMVSGPAARSHYAMAYDAARGVTVLFGGETNIGFSNETWEWTGNAWTQRAGGGPSPRVYHAMAYDAARTVTVLFGGVTSSGYNGETWGLSTPCDPVSFASQPERVALVPGGSAYFSVAVNGAPTSFRWRHDGVNLDDGPRISGSATATLTITSVQASDEGEYDCVVSSVCNTVTSNAALLSCDPIITEQPPASARLRAGMQLAVGVPPGAPYSYRWRQNGQNLFNIPGLFAGVTTRTLTILARDPSLAGSYDCVVTDVCGTTTSSACEVYCPADLDRDGFITGDDFQLFVEWFEIGDPGADFDEDGFLTGDDFTLFVEAFEAGC